MIDVPFSINIAEAAGVAVKCNTLAVLQKLTSHTGAGKDKTVLLLGEREMGHLKVLPTFTKRSSS
jgi:hypothetical protein